MSAPIVPGFYPDPTICRVGEEYFLAHSSFEYFPGVPLWRSTDLVRWSQLGHILTRRSQFVRGIGAPSGGLYAGTLRHRDGRFWYVTTNVEDFVGGQLIVWADDPAGPWSDPVWVPQALGIDPDLCWDADGQCYLTWKGESEILQARLDLATGELLEQARPLWQGSGMAAAEGPHLYAIGDEWLLLLAEGGTERGHAVTVARGPSPSGPFEGFAGNPVLSHRSSSHPVQNTGHADLVQRPDGTWGAVYLGVRPEGFTPGFHVNGRETFLAGIEWIDGWPSFVEEAFDVPAGDTGFVDDFAAAELDLRWVVPGGEAATTTVHTPGAALRVRPRADGSAGLLCTRVRDRRWTAEAVVPSSGQFSVRIDDRHEYALRRSGDSVEAIASIGDVRATVARTTVGEQPVILRISAIDPLMPKVPFGYPGPDDIALDVELSGEVRRLALLDGRYLSTEVASGFTGRVLALAATDLPGEFASIRYAPTR